MRSPPPHSLSYAFTTDGSHVLPLELGDYVSRTVKDRRTLAQAIGLVTFAGMLVSTVVGIAFPPAYFAMFSRLRAKSAHG